jgi:hypothetical protein
MAVNFAVSVDTIQRAIKELVTLGALEVEVEHIGLHRRNLYFLKYADPSSEPQKSGHEHRKFAATDTARVRLEREPLERELEKEKEKEKENLVQVAAFESFWDAYPKRQGPNPKQTARVAYERAVNRGAVIAAIRRGLEAYKRSNPGVDGAKYIAQAATWLNQRRWEDDYSYSHEPHQLSKEERRRLTS